MSSKERFSREQWAAICGIVTDRMNAFTRPFVTPLVHEAEGKPPRIGSGSYLEQGGATTLLTCQHVAVWQSQAHRPLGQEGLALLPEDWRMDAFPLDVAAIKLARESLGNGGARPLPMDALARIHDPLPDELLFFRGVAGENAYVGFGGFDGVMTGYCSQEKRGTGDGQLFEIFWEPENTKLTPGTHPEARARVKYDNAEGLSGSLVWNTRFAERDFDVNAWSPEDAVVTGLLRRWDTATRTLLAWRVEHLRSWLTETPTGERKPETTV